MIRPREIRSEQTNENPRFLTYQSNMQSECLVPIYVGSPPVKGTGNLMGLTIIYSCSPCPGVSDGTQAIRVFGRETGLQPP